MVCCVLSAAILAYVGRFFRRTSGRGDSAVTPQRPPPPTRVAVAMPSTTTDDQRVLVGADA